MIRNFFVFVLLFTYANDLFANEESDHADSEEQPQYIEEVIVYADLLARNTVDVPSSVSIVNDDQILEETAIHLEEILKLTPNVNFASGASRARFIQIRGIGERSQFLEPWNPSIGILLDGMDISDIGAMGLLFDIQQIEILRGPHGTSHGSNALGGLVNMRSKSVGEKPNGRIDTGVGAYNHRHFNFAFGQPITDSFGLRISLAHNRSNGYVENDFLDRNDTNNLDEQMIQLRLEWTTENGEELALQIGQADIDNGYDAFSLDNNRTTFADNPGEDSQLSQYFLFTSEGSFLDTELDYSSYVSFVQSELSYGYDEDWTYTGFHPYGYSSVDEYRRERQGVNYDLRLLSNSREGAGIRGLEWVAGLSLARRGVDLVREYTYSGLFTSYDYWNRVGVYGSASISLTSQTSIGLGARVESRELEYDHLEETPDGSNSAGFTYYEVSNNETSFGANVVVSHARSDFNTWFMKLSRGFKSGAFNTDGSLPLDLIAFDPEQLISFEIGNRYNYDRGWLSVVGFAMFRQDVQVSTYRSVLRSDGSTEFVQYIDNVARGSNSGIEIETEYAVNQHTHVRASIGLLRTDFGLAGNDRIVYQLAGAAIPRDEQAHAPSYQFSIGINRQFRDLHNVGISLDGKSAFYASSSHDVQIGDYIVANVRYSFDFSKGTTVSVWVKNLFNEAYHTRGFFFGNDPRKDYVAQAYTQLAAPRTFGANLVYNW